MAHSYPLLARHLAIYDQEFRYGELLQSIADFAPLGSRLLDWSVDDVSRFLSSLAFLQPLTSTITNIFQRECVDGEFLSRLDAAKWNTLLGLPIDKFVLLKVVLEGIQGNCALLAHSQPIGDLHPLVIAGVAADLSALPVETALALDAADRSCASTGTGYCYGQFVVLGFKEYYQDNAYDHASGRYHDKWLGTGLPNEKLVLKRRKVPNGVSAASGTDLHPAGREGAEDTPMDALDSPSSRSTKSGASSYSASAASIAARFSITFQHAAVQAQPQTQRDEPPAPLRFAGGGHEGHQDSQDREGQETHAPPRGLGPAGRRGALTLDTTHAATVGAAFRGHRVAAEAVGMMHAPGFLPEHPHPHMPTHTPTPTPTQLQAGRLPRGHATRPKDNPPPAPPAPQGPFTTTLVLQPDPTFDMFTIGRTPGNDLLVRGPMHEDRRGGQGSSTGPVSRHAVRILCERLPPFRSFVYAGGFDESGRMVISERAPKLTVPGTASSSGSSSSSSSSGSVDAVTFFGVRLWQPAMKVWTEVTVLGRVCDAQRLAGGAGRLLEGPLYTNELVDGSILDLAGVSIVFQSPASMARKTNTCHPESVIDSLNGMQPICPVQLHNIDFSFVEAKDRALMALRKMEGNDSRAPCFSRRMNFPVPSVDFSGVSLDHRSFVFPACGHVHGFHQNLDGQPCPMCRSSGPFCALAFSFEPAICHKRPTHVFNPCGHVASRAVCETWAAIPLPSLPNSQLPGVPRCPFCATELVTDKKCGGPFNRLVLQCDEPWASDDDDDDDDGAEEEGSVGASSIGTAGASLTSFSTGLSTLSGPTPRCSPLTVESADNTPLEMFLRDQQSRPLTFPKVMPRGAHGGDASL